MSDKQEQPTTEIEDAVRTRAIGRGRQIIGLFVGIGLGLMISSLVPAIRERYDLATVVLWSGMAGVVIVAFDQFQVAGAALTRSENRLLNYVVGFGLPLAFLLIVQFFVLP